MKKYGKIIIFYQFLIFKLSIYIYIMLQENNIYIYIEKFNNELKRMTRAYRAFQKRDNNKRTGMFLYVIAFIVDNNSNFVIEKEEKI